MSTKLNINAIENGTITYEKFNNDIKSNIESNELVTASAIAYLEERIKELEKKINQLLSNN